jgi:hypothetical protein
VMLSIIGLLQSAYNEFGYRLKMDKGSYLLGKCESALVAETRGDALLEIGFNPDIVKIHPDNSADTEVAKLKYGTKMLGGYLGTDEFVKSQLFEHLNKLRNESLPLLKYPDVQGRYLLFKHCSMPKPIHLLRTTRPDLTADFVEELEKIHLLILESLFRYQVKPALFNLLSLSTGLGGIGIQKICEIRPASYLCFLQRTGFSNHINRLRRISPADLKPREREFIAMASSCKRLQIWRDAFREGLSENQCRPDISIRNDDALDSASNVIHIDATITSSLEGSEMCQPVRLSVKKAQQKGHRAEEAYKKKINSIKTYGKRAAEKPLKMLWLFGLKLFLLF